MLAIPLLRVVVATVAVSLATSSVGPLSTSAAAPSERLPVTAPRVADRGVTSLKVAPREALSGEQVRVSGRTSSGVEPLALQLASRRGWSTVAKGKSTSSGSFALSFRAPAQPGSTRLRVLSRSGAHQSVREATVRVVAQLVTATPPEAVYVNKVATVAATVTPVRAGRTVTLEQMTDGQWKSVGSAKQSKSPKVSLEVTGSAPGTAQFRVTAAPWHGSLTASSEPFTVTVESDPTVVADNVTPLSQDDADDITSYNPETGSVIVDPSQNSWVDDLSKGDVLAVPPSQPLGLPSGALRAVTGIRQNEGRTIVDTRSANLPDVVENVPDDASEVAMPPVSDPVVSDVAAGVTVQTVPAVPPARTAKLATVDGPAVRATVSTGFKAESGEVSAEGKLEGSVTVTPVLELDLDMDWFKVKSYRVGAGLKVDDDLSVSVSTTLEKKWSVDLFTIRVTRGGFIGPVPVWATFTGKVTAEVSVDGTISTSVHWTRTGTNLVGVQGSQADGLKPHQYERHATSSAKVIKVTAAGSVTGGVYGSGQLDLYDLAGPYAQVGYQVKGEVSSDQEGRLTCELTHGPVAEVGLRTSYAIEKLTGEQLTPLNAKFELAVLFANGCPGQRALTGDVELGPDASDQGVRPELDYDGQVLLHDRSCRSYVTDRRTNDTKSVGDDGICFINEMTSDGKTVVYPEYAREPLVPASQRDCPDPAGYMYKWDRASNKTTWMDLSGACHYQVFSLSGNGRFLVYRVDGDGGLVLRDLVQGTNTQIGQPCDSCMPIGVSDDGNIVAYNGTTQYVARDGDQPEGQYEPAVFTWRRGAGTTIVSGGDSATLRTFGVALSADGTTLAYTRADDVDDATDQLYVRDHSGNTHHIAIPDWVGEAELKLSLSADGAVGAAAYGTSEGGEWYERAGVFWTEDATFASLEDLGLARTATQVAVSGDGRTLAFDTEDRLVEKDVDYSRAYTEDADWYFAAIPHHS